jgi:hypothetical protein
MRGFTCRAGNRVNIAIAKLLQDALRTLIYEKTPTSGHLIDSSADASERYASVTFL